MFLSLLPEHDQYNIDSDLLFFLDSPLWAQELWALLLRCFVCVCVCVLICVCVLMHVEFIGQYWLSLPSPFSFYDIITFWPGTTEWDWLASNSQDSPVLLFIGIASAHPHAWLFCVGSGAQAQVLMLAGIFLLSCTPLYAFVLKEC